MLLKNSVEQLIQRKNLDRITCQKVLEEMLAPETNPLQIAAFLVLLRAKPETPEELAALITTMRQKMISVPSHHKILDIVGTGGDGTNTINISTGSAILAASCGIKIAKHGNRAVSSLTGAADVLEALGINIHLSPEKISACIDEIGIGFCFAPNFHPAMQQLRPLRNQLNLPTTLNLLGPLLNPAHAQHLLLGVLHESLVPLIAQALKQTGTEHSIVAHGNGLDEISCVGPTRIMEITPNEITTTRLDPRSFGLPHCTIADLKGGNATDNAQLLIHAFSGKHKAIANTLILNAAVSLYLYGKYASIADAIPHAQQHCYDGSALKLLKQWKEFSNDQ